MLRITLTSLLLFLFATFNSFSKEKTEFLKLYKDDLVKIEKYLNNIKSLESSFLQETENGEISDGKIYLLKPGKMRIEHTHPTEIVIVVNGNVLTYSDIELEETSHLSTNSTPASFLTRKKFSFSAIDLEITDFDKVEDYTEVEIMKKNKKEAGKFRLIFRNQPFEFVRMEVKNDLDEVTTIYLTKTEYGKKINKKLFIVKNKNLPD
ncbi:MAG: outer membrane lipoprotein-sorting protein [Lentimonas sp.]|jgi:outer membrane lipoprotein-sorting protein